MDAISNFFAAIPDVLVALWAFGSGFQGVIIMVASIALIAVFAGLAYRLREQQPWLGALFGAMTTLLTLWWAMGIVPSAWVYFIDAERELLEGTIIPGAITVGPLDVASNFYNLFRDSVVMLINTVAIGGVFWVAIAAQKRFPKGLAEGEQKGPTTGGYK